jgi:hypothetical protein
MYEGLPAEESVFPCPILPLFHKLPRNPWESLIEHPWQVKSSGVVNNALVVTGLKSQEMKGKNEANTFLDF